jgi:LuxR family transcriptional regulator, maltose regulon positive regulatory protein
MLTLRVLAQQAQHHPDAVNALERALRLAAPEGYVRVFLEEGVPMAAFLAELGKRGSTQRYGAQLPSQ